MIHSSYTEIIYVFDCRVRWPEYNEIFTTKCRLDLLHNVIIGNRVQIKAQCGITKKLSKNPAGRI